MTKKIASDQGKKLALLRAARAVGKHRETSEQMLRAAHDAAEAGATVTEIADAMNTPPAVAAWWVESAGKDEDDE